MRRSASARMGTIIEAMAARDPGFAEGADLVPLGAPVLPAPAESYFIFGTRKAERL